MTKFTHLDPEERKQIVDNIVEKLEKRLTEVVKTIVGNYAVTEPEVLERLSAAAANAVDFHIQKHLRRSWFHRLFYK